MKLPCGAKGLPSLKGRLSMKMSYGAKGPFEVNRQTRCL